MLQFGVCLSLGCLWLLVGDFGGDAGLAVIWVVVGLSCVWIGIIYICGEVECSACFWICGFRGLVLVVCAESLVAEPMVVWLVLTVGYGCFWFLELFGLGYGLMLVCRAGCCGVC